MARKDRAIPYINVTPLIDVLLVLLIIFMVISPARPSKFETKTPRERPPDDSKIDYSLSLVVVIQRDGSYQLNQQPAGTLEKLEGLLRFALDGRPPELKAVFVKAPRMLDYGEVVKVIDVVKAAGSAPIGLQIDNLDQ
ncbi:MAG: biopolymer transporter ExbD [Acidobacteria bacterium]|nr:biopolymer transporter ExbD [Acidobacteriota bacterium]